MAKTAHFKEGKSKKGLKELASRLNKNHGRGSVEINFQANLTSSTTFLIKTMFALFTNFKVMTESPMLDP